MRWKPCEVSCVERCIVDLILKVVTVPMETQKIVAKLPRLEFEWGQPMRYIVRKISWTVLNNAVG